jgi:hypothetical protein
MTIIPYKMDEMIANSYKNFHAKGFNYICLHRSDKHTLKVYILDGDITKVPEVINPHDHRYSFRTEVLAGGMCDHQYHPNKYGIEYERYNYFTPLNGGKGFEEDCVQVLLKHSVKKMDRPGDFLYSPYDRIHTISMLKDQTMLLVDQEEDVLRLDEPTSCWVRTGHPKPDTSGLYEKFTPGQIKEQLKLIESKSIMVFHEITS